MVYLLKFGFPLGTVRHSAQFYVGYCADDQFNERLAEHRAGTGAALTRGAAIRGASIEVVKTWPNGDRTLEQQIKRQKHHARLIPAGREMCQ